MNRIWQVVLATRPYSWFGVVLLGMLASVLSKGALVIDLSLFLNVLIALLLWVVGLLFIEFHQRGTDGRLRSMIIPAFSLVLLAAILLIRNPFTVFLVLLLLLLEVLYSRKTKNPYLGPMSFLLRGAWDVLVLVILFLVNGSDPLLHTPIIAAVYLLSVSRNLIGDVRDVSVDEFTFPKRFGRILARGVSATMALFAALLISDLMIVFPVLVISVMIALVDMGYLLHRAFVICTTFFLANNIIYVIGQDLLLVNILFLGALFNLTYDKVPRKSNVVSWKKEILS